MGEREREGRERDVKGERDDEFHETVKCRSIPLFVMYCNALGEMQKCTRSWKVRASARFE